MTLLLEKIVYSDKLHVFEVLYKTQIRLENLSYLWVKHFIGLAYHIVICLNMTGVSTQLAYVIQISR